MTLNFFNITISGINNPTSILSYIEEFSGDLSDIDQAYDDANNSSNVSCPLCNCIYDTNEILSHILKIHSNFKKDIMGDMILSESKKTGEVLCNYCSMAYQNYEAFCSHCIEKHLPNVLNGLEVVASKQNEEKKNNLLNLIKEYKTDDKIIENHHEPVKVVTEYVDDSANQVENKNQKIQKEETKKYNEEPLTPISLSNILVSEKPIEETAVDFAIRQIEKSELLYRKLNIAVFDKRPTCGICNHCYDSIMELILHCLQTHPYDFTPELKYILHYLGNFTTIPTDSQIYEKCTDLHLDLLFKPPIEIPEKPTAELWLTVPRFFGELIVELFGVNRPESEKSIIPKSNWNEDVIWLQLPYKIPFIFLTTGNKLKIGFIETKQVPAETSRNIVKSILTTISKNQFLVIQMKDIWKESFQIDVLNSISSTYDVRILRKTEISEDSNNSKSITLFIYCTNWTEDHRNTITSVIAEYFEKSALYRCSVCRSLYRKDDTSLCSNARMSGLVISRKVPHSLSETYASIMTNEFLKSTDLIKKYEI